MDRVFLVSAEFNASASTLIEERRLRPYLGGHAAPAESIRVFFSYPRMDELRRDSHEAWGRDFGVPPIRLIDLLASAAHRALGSFHDSIGAAAYESTRKRVTDLFVTSMPGMIRTITTTRG